MKEHEFTLILTREPDESASDSLYGKIDGGTISTISGIPQIHFIRQAGSLEEAIRSAIVEVKAAGFEALRVELEPESLLHAI